MEKKEIFRAQNVRIRQQDGAFCTLSFNLIEGELLGVHVPRTHRGQSVITDVIMKKTTDRSGGLFYYETESGSTRPPQGWPIVTCVQRKKSLVEEMSVIDNLFLLRKRKNRGAFYSKRALMREAARQMEAYGLPFQPEQTVSSLSKMEKHVLEIFKAFLHGAQIIILDQIAWDTAGSDAVKQLLALIEQLKREEITFLMVSDSLSNLRACADRIAFFDGTQIVSILENCLDNYGTISETFDALVRSYAKDRFHRITCLERGKQIPFGDPILASLRLVQGEKVAVYDTEGLLLGRMADKTHRKHIPLAGGYILTEKAKRDKWKERPRTIIADFGRYDQIFTLLPVSDNLLIGRSDGLQMLKIVGNKYREMLKREFMEQFGDGEMLDIKESWILTPEQRFKLYLFKMMLVNPDVVIAWRNPKADPVLVRLLEDTIATFTENKKTFCYLLLDMFEQVDNVDRYILLSRNGAESFATYGELLRHQMMLNDSKSKADHGDIYV